MKGRVSCSGVDGHVSGSPACPPMSRLSRSLIRRVCSWPGGRLILDPGAQPVPPAPSRLEEGRAVHLCPGDLRSPRCAAVLQAYGASEGAVREAGGRELAGEQRRRGGAKQSLQGNGARLSTVGGGGGGDGELVPPPPRSRRLRGAGSNGTALSTLVPEVRSLPPTESSSIRWFGLLTGQV